MPARRVLLSIDGLTEEQLQSVTADLQSTRALISGLKAYSLDTSPFAEAQPIWAQLLTGTTWSENGCAGYAYPSNSLNRLEVFTETALGAAVNLIADAPDTVCINVPLLEPRKRSWIADGSLPLLQNVSPADLQELFAARYKPRPFPSLVTELQQPRLSAKELIAVESKRLAAAKMIFSQRSWGEAIVRITIFDQLQHLFGRHCLIDPQHIIADELKSLLKQLDDLIATIVKLDGEIAIISAYSHVRCRSRLNTNEILRRHGYLEIAPQTSETINRLMAVESISGKRPSAASVEAEAARLAVAQTTAASPVAGCIYLNTKRHFSDGKVPDTESGTTADNLFQLLNEQLYFYFGGRSTLHRREEGAGNKVAERAPDFVIHVPEVEFYDGSKAVLDTVNKPAYCHQAKGFLLIDRQCDKAVVTPVDTNKMLRDSGFGRA